MTEPNGKSVITKRRALAQVVICKACCCGQTDKGKPALPEERIRSIWKAGKLKRTIQLTISGCVGPCDVANVVQIVTPSGIEWFGRLQEETEYDALIEWARACDAAGAIAPRPARLTVLQFTGYIGEAEHG